MHIFNWAVVAYFAIILLLVNCSLLFCDDKQHCLYPFKELPVSKETAYFIRVSITNLIPLPFKTVQQIGQWAILIQTVFLLYFLLKVLRSLISFLCQLLFLFLLFSLGYLAYRQYEKSPEQALERWGQLAHQAWSMLERLWARLEGQGDL